jgi:hypothetical protein
MASPIDPTTRPIKWLSGVLIFGISAGIVAYWREPVEVAVLAAADMPAGGDDIAGDDEGELPMLPRRVGPGDLVLRGVVVDTAGAPIAGVQLFAELEAPTAVPRMPDPIKPTSVFTSWRAVAPPTDVNGAFSLDGLIAAQYRLVVRGSGIATAELRQVTVPAPANEPLRIVASRRVMISGKVVDGKQLVSGARVAIRSDAIGGVLETVTDKAGLFAFRDLPEGGYQVWAWQDDLAAAAQRVLRQGNLPSGEVVLILGSATVVVGRVIDRDDGVGVAAVVELSASNDREAPRYAQSGPDGVFRIEGVPPGRWVADAFAPGYLTSQTVELQAGRGIPEIMVSSGAIVEGKIVSFDGRPVRGAMVSAVVNTDNGKKEISQLAESQRLRRFDGAVMATVRAPQAATHQADAHNASSGLMFEARGELGVLRPVPPIPMVPLPSSPGAGVPAVVPLGVMASPVRATLAFAQRLVVDPARSSQWITDTDGHYRIRALPGGELSIRVQSAGYPQVLARVGTAVDGEVLAAPDIVLSLGALLTGRVISQERVPVAGASVAAVAIDGTTARGVTDAGGVYQLGPLVGMFAVTVDKPGFTSVTQSATLAAVDGATSAVPLDFYLQSSNARLDGIVEDERGVPLRGATIAVASSSTRAVASPDGTFHIDRLAPGRVKVSVMHPRYPTYNVELNTGERARLRVPLGGGISGVVINDSTSSGVAGVTLTAVSAAGLKATTVSNTKGLFSLLPLATGVWKVTVAHTTFAKVVKNIVVAAASEPGQPSVRDLRFELRGTSTIAGVVRDDRGQRVAGAMVVITSAESECRGITGQYGEYTIRNCPSGDLTVSASSDDASGIRTIGVRAGADVREIAVEIR